MIELDPHLTLAFTLAASPGSYAILLGAGVSIGAGVPTAWGVQQNLIERIARACGETPPDLSGWFAERYGQDPTYDHLLEALAPTSFERQALLRAYFEPADEPRPSPSGAHKALAELVSAGHVRVILTTNFDKLTEAALHAVGVEPTVVSSATDIAGLEPLHLQTCLVVHLHGDYLTPTAMLNTAGELSTYDAALDRFLDVVLAEYGLLIVGWSAQWDRALRAAIGRRSARRFSTYWVEPSTLGTAAKELATQQGAQLVQATADEFLGLLRDAVLTVGDRGSPDPRSLPVAIAVAKRELAGGTIAIPLHDRVRREFERVLGTATRLSGPQTTQVALSELEQGCEVYLGLVAAMTYWGTPQTDRWWTSDLARLAQPAPAGGTVAVLHLRQVPALLTLHAAGTAAVAAERWEVVAWLLEPSRVWREVGYPDELPMSAMSPQRLIQRSDAASHVHDVLSGIFIEHLALGASMYIDCWERFEYLRLLACTSWALAKDSSFGSDLPHIRALGHTDAYRPAPRDWLSKVISNGSHPLLAAGAFDGDHGRLQVAQTTYDEMFSQMATEASWSRLSPGRAGQLPPGPFYPALTPKYRGRPAE